jgi:TPR repeat protein
MNMMRMVLLALLSFVLAGCGSCGSRVPTAQEDDAACAKGDAPACERRLARMKASCDMKEVKACIDVADAYLSAMHAPKDENQAVQWFAKACELKDARSCYMFSRAQFTGNGAPRDMAASNATELKACELGHPESCLARARCHEDGQVFYGCKTKDLKKARELWTKYCEVAKIDPSLCTDVRRIDDKLIRGD